jgi:hypothetical protein
MRDQRTRIYALFPLPLLAAAAGTAGIAVAAVAVKDEAVSHHARAEHSPAREVASANRVERRRGLAPRGVARVRPGPGVNRARAIAGAADDRREGPAGELETAAVPAAALPAAVLPGAVVPAPGLTVPTQAARPRAASPTPAPGPVGAPPASAPEAPEPGASEEEEPPAVDPAVPVGSGTLVIGVDGGYAGWSATEIGERAALGAAVTRHEWDPARPVDQQDEVVEIAAGTLHSRIHALLGANRLGDPTHYREWVVAFIRRYGPGGSFWAAYPALDASRYAITTVELGNEPYFGEMSAGEYADTVRPTLEAIHELRLPVAVSIPAYVHGEDTSWIDTIYERIPDLNSLFDNFAFHPYWYGHDPAEPGNSGPFERIETVRRTMDAHGAAAKPIYLTEYGESTAACGGECVSEQVQAQHLQAMLAAVAANVDWKVGMLLVFQLCDRGTASGDRELQFGLLREDGTAKPAYAPVRAAMRVYR